MFSPKLPYVPLSTPILQHVPVRQRKADDMAVHCNVVRFLCQFGHDGIGITNQSFDVRTSIVICDKNQATMSLSPDTKTISLGVYRRIYGPFKCLSRLELYSPKACPEDAEQIHHVHSMPYKCYFICDWKHK